MIKVLAERLFGCHHLVNSTLAGKKENVNRYLSQCPKGHRKVKRYKLVETCMKFLEERRTSVKFAECRQQTDLGLDYA